MKAQFWSFDVIFAVVIFSVSLTILAFAWYNVSTQLSISVGGGSYTMQLQADQLASELGSAGFPSNWQADINASSPGSLRNVAAGLAQSSYSGSLSMQKIYALMAISNYNYTYSQEFLGVGYDYYITIEGGQYNISIGKNPLTSGALTIFLSKRSAFLNGIPVHITVYIWSNEKTNYG